MRVDYFQIWLDHSAAESIIDGAKDLGEEGFESVGYHVEVDITGETVEDFFRNLIVDPVQIGYSGVTDSNFSDPLEDIDVELEDFDMGDEEREYEEQIITKHIQEAVPVPSHPSNYNPEWLKWANNQLHNQGFETEIYMEAEGQGSNLNQALEEAGYNAEMGIELNGEERYSLKELDELV